MKRIVIAAIFVVLANLPILVQCAENESLPVLEIDGLFYRADETNKTLYPIEILSAFNQTPAEINETNSDFAYGEGDIIFGATGSGEWTTNTGHVGIFVSENGELKVREAYPGKGVQTISLQDFMRDYETVDVYRVDGASESDRHAAAEKAKEFMGGYWLLPPEACNKYDNTLWYCSKLVYRAYLDATNINLDKDCTPVCCFVSPCDIIQKSGKVWKIGAFREPSGGFWHPKFDCSNRWCGC